MFRPQFTLKTLLWLMAVVAAFVGGAEFERERQRRADLRAAKIELEAKYRSVMAEMADLQLWIAQSNKEIEKLRAELPSTLPWQHAIEPTGKLINDLRHWPAEQRQRNDILNKVDAPRRLPSGST